MDKKSNVRETKHMFELLINKEVLINLKDNENTKVKGLLIHQTQFEILIKANVKYESGEKAEKLRIIPKHSILIAKEI